MADEYLNRVIILVWGVTMTRRMKAQPGQMRGSTRSVFPYVIFELVSIKYSNKVLLFAWGVITIRIEKKRLMVLLVAVPVGAFKASNA